MLQNKYTEGDGSMSKYRATDLITKVFDERGIKYRVSEGVVQEEVEAGFSIEGGPMVVEKFISIDDCNDVAVRIFSFINNVPKDKQERILKACNYVNDTVRFMKFSMDDSGDVNISYDFPTNTDDCCVGEMAVEIFVRTMRILKEFYPVFMKALFTNEEIQSSESHEDLMQRMRRQIDERVKENENPADKACESTSDDDSEEEETNPLEGLISMLKRRMAEGENPEEDLPAAANQ